MPPQVVKLAPAAARPSDPVETVVLRRGSTRRFLHAPISFAELSTILTAASTPLGADFRESDRPINDLYLIANAIEGLSSGTYFFERDTQQLALLKSGEFRAEAAYLCLEQPLLGQAAAVIFLMADLEREIESLGPRGYRAALLEAGILGGRLYLAAYALRLGATGTTFYDEEVTAFFSPHAQGKAPMLAIGVGRDPRFRGTVNR